MAVRPARAVRVVCCGVLLAALVVGAVSLGCVQPAVAAEETGFERSPAAVGGTGDRLPVAPQAAPDRFQAQPNETDGQLLEDFDRVETTFAIAENGSAAVTVVYRYILEGNESSADWEDLRTDIEDRPESYVAGERDRWNATLADAENVTERNMSVTGFSVRTDHGMTPREYGEVTFTFRWSSFATVEPKWIGVGDALQVYTLDDGTTLRISWPESYSPQSVTPEPDDDSRANVVSWRGEETDFLEDEPRVELLQEGEPPQQEPDRPSRGLLVPLLLGGLVLLWLGLAVVWWLRRPGDEVETPSTPADAPPTPVADPPPELLSNEERVLTLLEANGGRMKQQTVVGELGWTEAKTSQVVGEMRDRGDVEVFRLGRENVLALPDSADEADAE